MLDFFDTGKTYYDVYETSSDGSSTLSEVSQPCTSNTTGVILSTWVDDNLFEWGSYSINVSLDSSFERKKCGTVLVPLSLTCPIEAELKNGTIYHGQMIVDDITLVSVVECPDEPVLFPNELWTNHGCTGNVPGEV